MKLEDVVISGIGVDLRALTRGNPLTNQVQQRLLDLSFLDPPVDGDFGPISHHPEDNVGTASAGCLVGRSTEEHREFMRVVKADPRRRASQGYKYVTTIIDGRDLSTTA